MAKFFLSLFFCCVGVFLHGTSVTVIVVPHCANAFSDKGIRSSIAQKYSDLSIIYVASEQNAAIWEKVDRLARRTGKFQCQRDSTVIESVYRLVHALDDDELVIFLDSHNEFIDENVVEKIVAYHKKTGNKLAYGSTSFEDGKRIETITPIPKVGDTFLHTSLGQPIRSFFANEFKKIPLNRVLFNKSTCLGGIETRFISPLAQTVKVGKIPGILDLTPISYRAWCHNPKRSSYRKLAEYFYFFGDFKPIQESSNTDVDLVVFSFDRPMQLYAFLESCEKFCKGISNIFIIYRTSKPIFYEGYEVVKRSFPQAKYILENANEPSKKQSTHLRKQKEQTSSSDFNALVLKYSFDRSISNSDFIAYGVDDIIFIRDIDFSEEARILERTGAYGYYYRYGIESCYSFMTGLRCKVPTFFEVDKGINAWQIGESEGIWNYANSVDVVLYKKESIEKNLRSIRFRNPNFMEAEWQRCKKNFEVGICPDKPCIVNIPLNIVSAFNTKHLNTYNVMQLMNKFKRGEKIDIKPLENYECSSPHIAYNPTFVPREAK